MILDRFPNQFIRFFQAPDEGISVLVGESRRLVPEEVVESDTHYLFRDEARRCWDIHGTEELHFVVERNEWSDSAPGPNRSDLHKIWAEVGVVIDSQPHVVLYLVVILPHVFLYLR